MPSVVRGGRSRAVAAHDQPGLVVLEDDQAAGGGLQLLDQSTVTGARWVDVQGCCGVHGFASLCGGRVRRLLTLKVILVNKNIILVVLNRPAPSCISHHTVRKPAKLR